MIYARARLWLGITGVGTIVVFCLLSLLLRIPSLLSQTDARPIWRDGYELAGVLFIYCAVQGAFDFFGGHILPTEYGRTTARFGTFFRGWLRGVVAHSVILLLAGLALISAARVGGFWGATGTFVAVSIFLLATQGIIASLIGGARYRVRKNDAPGLPPVTLVSGTSSYLTGGIVGLPGFERVVVPARWLEILSADEWAAVLRRRFDAVRTRARSWGVLLALGFNTAGFALAYVLAGGTASVASLVATSLWFTLWSFLGLLTLPTPSQKGVFQLDASARDSGVEAATLSQAIRKLDREQDDEPTRPGGVERIFHPIPSVERRLARLAAPETAASGAWHAARMAIYLSWAGMSFLSRAVHCNSGRPDAWVFLPSD